MASIKDLEMAAALSSHQHITIKKSLFSRKAVYEPTQSTLQVSVQEYAPAEGERMSRLLALPPAKLATELQKGKPQPTPVGHYRLEVCLSADRQFCAMQLFRFDDFRYTPVSEPLFYEGSDVQAVATLIA